MMKSCDRLSVTGNVASIVIFDGDKFGRKVFFSYPTPNGSEVIERDSVPSKKNLNYNDCEAELDSCLKDFIENEYAEGYKEIGYYDWDIDYEGICDKTGPFKIIEIKELFGFKAELDFRRDENGNTVIYEKEGDAIFEIQNFHEVFRHGVSNRYSAPLDFVIVHSKR